MRACGLACVAAAIAAGDVDKTMMVRCRGPRGIDARPPGAAASLRQPREALRYVRT